MFYYLFLGSEIKALGFGFLQLTILLALSDFISSKLSISLFLKKNVKKNILFNYKILGFVAEDKVDENLKDGIGFIYNLINDITERKYITKIISFIIDVLFLFVFLLAASKFNVPFSMITSLSANIFYVVVYKLLLKKVMNAINGKSKKVFSINVYLDGYNKKTGNIISFTEYVNLLEETINNNFYDDMDQASIEQLFSEIREEYKNKQ